MNERQKLLLILIGAVLVGMALYPTGRVLDTGAGKSAGYAWIFDPPFAHRTVDTGILLIRLLAVLIAGAIVFWLLRYLSRTKVIPHPRGAGNSPLLPEWVVG